MPAKKKLSGKELELEAKREKMLRAYNNFEVSLFSLLEEFYREVVLIKRDIDQEKIKKIRNSLKTLQF
jgi:hypothetical protein